MAPVQVVGAGPHEWVWAAIAAGDVTVVRAAPADFDVNEVHPKYGTVLTAFLQGLLNRDGRFFTDPCRPKRVVELVDELGRRGARPDQVIPEARIDVEGLYQEWRLTGQVTAMQAIIQMRNDLVAFKLQTVDQDQIDGADIDVSILSDLIEKYAALTVQGTRTAQRSMIPDAVLDVWERCLESRHETGDVVLKCVDGTVKSHSLVLVQASPVVSAMLRSEMSEGTKREIVVDESTRVVEMFMSLLYTGCVPSEPDPEGPAKMTVGLRVNVSHAFMSNSAKSTLLHAGLAGEVHSIDAAGDALVKFDGNQTRQWVSRKNYWRLRESSTDEMVQLTTDMVGVLNLAHRWQVLGLAVVLAERLERDITVESVEPLLDTAVLHNSSRLRAACLSFAKRTPKVKAAFEAGEYRATVMEVLRCVFDDVSRKRPRRTI